MSKVMAGDVFSCEVCGLAVVVDECGCAMAEIICCEEPMINKGPSTRKKSPPAAKPSLNPRATTNGKPSACPRRTARSGWKSPARAMMP